MLKITKSGVKEIGYSLADDAKLGAIFGIGNGYFGIRGSLEEFGDVFIQGTYIRGVFDQIVEIPITFSDNIYMKKYYFDEQKLKEFELEDSCINIVDPLTIRFVINGKLFLPWDGKILSWTRYIDTKTGGLVRKCKWEDGEGNITEFTFSRHASFANNHIILQEATARKINHNLPVEILMGIDTLVKTNGQHKSVVVSKNNHKDGVSAEFFVGNKYNMHVALESRNEVDGAEFNKLVEENGRLLSSYLMTNDFVKVNKVISMYANIDPVDDYKEATKISDKYEKLYAEHLVSYKKAFKRIDIKVEGNDEIDTLLRYANYQTLIGFDRFDSVHSLSAKNLTAEKYNQFVWWDAEIFQLPIVISSFPEAAKACLEYRYRNLKQSKKNAELEGLRGARYAFCSSVKGDENVWIYARHPFLQIHISADVAYGVYNYYRQTLDKKFLSSKGLPMMVEIMDYFHSRATKVGNELQFLNCTGTDEHHPYINNDAYTNYEVKFLANKTIELVNELDFKVEKDKLLRIKELAEKLFVPQPDKRGIIPQFDGYLNLKPYLPIAGNGSGTGFQMKASGLYHKSQIIKQPDVLNLYTYLDIGLDEKIYKKNWKYYYKMCEASSSLTFPVHTISAIDFEENDVFLENLHNSLEIDIKDIHNCAYQGVHAGCLAGGWYAFYRGIFGIRPQEDGLKIEPKFNSPFEKVTMPFAYQGVDYVISVNKNYWTLKSSSNKPVKLFYKSKTVVHKGITKIYR